MYVSDAVEAIRRIVEGPHWNRTVNLAAGHPVTIEALVHKAAGLFCHHPMKLDKQGVAHESNRFWGSTGEMKHLYNFEAETNLVTGLTRLRDFLSTAALLESSSQL